MRHWAASHNTDYLGGGYGKDNNGFGGYDNAQRGGYASSGNPVAAQKGQSNAQRVQDQIDDVVNIMQENIDSVMKRGENLDQVGQKTDRLRDETQVFHGSAVRVRKKMWWNNMKWKIIIGVCLIIIILVIVLSVVLSKKN
ncbi:Vesicle membrane receptor protein (v-SNARE) [Coemansia sp. RSA 2711]|nr:Vesicle membrane receptor protein (v-SNARE) [Coemansia sp. RSA 2711]KAJ2364613.1 Vesicle membrane receptor protein (v-SNARE) [Coemansia sp. RSA 2610]